MRRLAPALIGTAFLFVAAFTLAPMLWPGSAVGLTARWVFAGLCHRDPARSFALDGHTMAVCHRCAGIYGGLALGAYAALGLRLDPSKLWIWAAGGAPLALQVGLAWIWPALDLPALRIATGLLAGATGGLLLASAIRGRD